ncbi:glycosyltransferase [uncultured Catenibacterium sp.]|uniref:glycosyltransferase n=1 Tax=uncultured Catenibacterium sp. TaxID=286142 RepID=UPI00259A0C6F|nr:glycosyltransferase [uncultured Catenibacterium sp.]
MNKYPKVLIINDQSIYKENATGITLRSFFKLYPSSNIREFHLWKPSKSEYEGLKINSSVIPQETFPINSILRKMTGADISEESKGIGFGTGISILDINKKSIKFSIKEYVKWISETFFINIDSIVSVLEDEQFVPDIIYTFGARFAIHNLVFKLSQYYKCPVCIHYMDNWRETCFLNTAKCLKLNEKLNKSVDRIEKLGEFSLVISPLMARKYAEFYHGNYQVLMNSIDVTSTSNTVEKFNDDEVLFVYAGGLHLNRYLGLLDIQESILNSALNSKLLIYTNDESRKKYESLFDKNVTTFKDFLPHDKVHEIYSEADILVHIESFEEERQLYTKYSLSTKIPEYMYSGKPILCFASKKLAVSQYIIESKSGICCDTKEELNAAVVNLALSSELRMNLGRNGKRVAISNHNISKAREVLVNVFIQNIQHNIWEIKK